MSSRAGRAAPYLALTLLLALVSTGDVGARERQEPTVVVTQNGVETTEVESGSLVTIIGTGFTADGYARVCIEEHRCTGAKTDSRGEFSTGRVLEAPGTHFVKVYEVSKTRRFHRLRAMTEITVMK